MSDNSFNNSSEAVEAAPEAEDTAVSADANSGAPTEEGEPPEPKTFTQEDINKIVAKETAKAERKLRRELEARATEAQQRVTAEPNPADYKNAVEYAEAKAEYLYNQRVTQHEQQKQFDTTVSTHLSREEQAREEYDDYDDVALADDLPVTQEMALVIVESEIGPKVLYWLGQNPREAARISQLSPLAQAREIGKIEAALSVNPPVKKVSQAPDPIRPVGARSTTPKYEPTDPRSVKTMSDSEWIEARNRQRMKRAQG